MTKSDPRVQIGKQEITPIVEMVTPGRRALGEQWSRVTVGHTATDDPDNPDAIVVEREDAPAPAQGRPAMVMPMGNMDPEMVHFILDHALARQASGEARAPVPELTDADVQRMWLDFCEQKLKWLKGQTTLGPAGFNQREKVIHERDR